jgi:hypothetical protein
MAASSVHSERVQKVLCASRNMVTARLPLARRAWNADRNAATENPRRYLHDLTRRRVIETSGMVLPKIVTTRASYSPGLHIWRQRMIFRRRTECAVAAGRLASCGCAQKGSELGELLRCLSATESDTFGRTPRNAARANRTSPSTGRFEPMTDPSPTKLQVDVTLIMVHKGAPQAREKEPRVSGAQVWEETFQRETVAE